MYDYVVKELPKLLSENFPQLDTARASISGHSMGGHGALTIYLKNLDKYKVLIPIYNAWNVKMIYFNLNHFICVGTFSLSLRLHQSPIPLIAHGDKKHSPTI